jgi:hypothetical protein
MDNKLLLQDAISKVAEIDYESDQVLIQQRIGAVAVNDLVSRFNELGESVTDMVKMRRDRAMRNLLQNYVF